MKTKSFWVPDKHLYGTATECLKMWPGQAAALCYSRSEVDINWEEIRNKYRGPGMFDESWAKIKELVEKSLMGPS